MSLEQTTYRGALSRSAFCLIAATLLSIAAQAKLTVTPASTAPQELAPSIDPADRLRKQIQDAQAELDSLNSGTSQMPATGGVFAAANEEQAHEELIEQTRRNLIRLKQELRDAELQKTFAPPAMTMVDTVLATLGRPGKNIEDQFRLQLPPCAHPDVDQTNHLQLAEDQADQFETQQMRPNLEKLNDSTTRLREHFKKMRKTAKNAPKATWDALTREEEPLKREFERNLTIVAKQQEELHRKNLFYDAVVRDLSRRLDKSAGCDPTQTFRASPSQRDDERAVFATMGNMATPFTAADVDRGFNYLKAYGSYDVGEDSSALPATQSVAPAAQGSP